MQIDRRPPSLEEAAQLLAARIRLHGRRETTKTISPDAASSERSARSRRHCHMPAAPRPRHPSPPDSGAYVPELAARIENDRNLTDGARRCARKITEFTFRRNREGREVEITVSYLAKALGRCRRTVQRYLRQLEREGYIDVRVVPSARTRMCFGLLIRVLSPLLPRHRQHKWPEKGGKPDATPKSQIYIQRYKRRPIPRAAWALLCCDGVWRSHMKSLSPPPPFPLTA